MEVYTGIDLHSSNSFIGVIDGRDRRLYKKRLPNDLDTILSALAPFKKDLVGVVVESTYNWYWLVDGLQEDGYKVHLANPAAIKQYEGLKHTDDESDSFWLAHMRRLNILAEGYIYPKEERPLRDLLRRRLLFVKHSTAHILSLQSTITRNLGTRMSVNAIKKLTEADANNLFDSPHLVLIAKSNVETISHLTKILKRIEKEVMSQIRLRKEFKLLLTIPGIGNILALTIMLEVGDIRRFAKVGNYSSYCRCVRSERLSNGKKKDENNRKNGNKYLSWAYVEAANFAMRFCPRAQRFYQRKKAKTNGIVAIKALANKISRASYYVMRDQIPYDVSKVFG
ncbi:MAG: IS110 family transposase [Desulfobacterales bacterium]|nr:IS110 family transposase [Desulfobacterales bacterium]